MSSDSEHNLEPISAFSMYNQNKLRLGRVQKRKRDKKSVLKSLQTQECLKLVMNQHNNSDLFHEGVPKGRMNKVPKKNNVINVQPETSIKKSTDSLDGTDNPYSDALRLFEWLVAPISADCFFTKFWEQKALHIKRSNERYYKHIFTSSSLDKILRDNHLYYTQNVDVVCYENGIKNVYNPEGRAVPSAVWDYYSNGCSIRILNPHTYSHKVHLLIATLQEYFGCMVGANIYLTPPGSQGFAPHYDDIEALVIQLEGRKHWKLYQPKDSDRLARYSSGNFKREEIGNPFMELTLNAGELLYFPRGTIHEGSTDEKSHSLHITVSLYQNTSYADLLEPLLLDALRTAAENDLEFRRGLPLDYLKKSGISCQFKDQNLLKSNVCNLMKSLIKYVDIDSAVDKLGRKFIYDSMPPVLSKSEAERCSKSDGPHLDNGRVLNRVEISLDTRIRLIRYYCIRLVNEVNGSPKLYYNTENAAVYHGHEEQWLELDSSMVPCIQTLQSSYPSYIDVETLPLKDVVVKMQLVSDLWEHGILITEQPLEKLED